MKIGKLNKLDGLTINTSTSVTSEKGYPVTNIRSEESLQVWAVEDGTVTLSLEFSSISAQAICLFNLVIEDDVTVKTFNSSATETNSITVNQANLSGLDFKNGFFELSDTADIVKIQVITNGATSTFLTSLGYLWVGDLMDFGILEALAPTDEDTSDTTITRANSTSTNKKYNFQRFKITTNKETTFSILQSNVREIIQNGGYSKKRPFILDECVYTNNLFLGIFDSGIFQYDILNPDNNYAQTSKGIIEVF